MKGETIAVGVIRSLLFGLCLLLFVLAVVVATIGTWGLRTVLDTNQFVSTADAVLLDPSVQEFLADRISARIGQFVVDAEGKVIRTALGALGLQPGATAEQVQTAVQPTVKLVLADPRTQAVLTDALRELHQHIVAVAASSGALTIQGDTLYLDLDQVVAEVDQRIDPTHDGLFGQQIPAGLGQIPLVRSSALRTVSAVMTAARIAQWLLVVVVLGVAVLSLVFARRRSNAVMWLGALLVVGGLFCLGLVLVAGSWLPAAAQTPSGQAALQGAISGFLSGLLVESAIVVAIGVGVMVLGFLASRMTRKPEPGIAFGR